MSRNASRKGAISEFPKWRKHLILLSFLDNSSARPVQIGGVDVNICHSRSTAVRGRRRSSSQSPPRGPFCRTRTGPVEADGAVDAQNAPTAPWKTLCVFHELPQGLSHQVTHEKLRKAPKYRWETRIDPERGVPMTHYRSLNHSKWACQYHVVFIPTYRKKAIYGELRQYLGEVLRRLARQRESEVEEGHLLVDHVHRMLSIPPKYSVAQVIGYIKGKSAIHIAREFAGRSRSFVGQHFWARGYFVSTLGRDERAIRAYIRTQELEDRRQEQLRLDERSQGWPKWPRSGHVRPPASQLKGYLL